MIFFNLYNFIPNNIQIVMFKSQKYKPKTFKIITHQVFLHCQELDLQGQSRQFNILGYPENSWNFLLTLKPQKWQRIYFLYSSILLYSSLYSSILLYSSLSYASHFTSSRIFKYNNEHYKILSWLKQWSTLKESSTRCSLSPYWVVPRILFGPLYR